MSSITGQLSSLSVGPGGQTMTPEQAARIAAGAAAAVPEAQLEEITACKPKIPFGTVGQTIELYANYFNIILKTGEINIHRYEVEIVRPSSDRKIDKDTNRFVFWRAVEDNKEFFGKITNLIYDDARCLWTAGRLNMDRGQETLRIKSRFGDRIDFAISFKYTSTFTIDVSRDDAVRSMTVQFLDALLTQRLRCPMHDISQFFYPFGRSVYLIARNDSERKRFNHSIGPGIEAWNGIHGAVKVGAKGQALYNCDVSSSAFAKIRMSVFEFFIEVLNDGVRNKTFARDLEDPGVANRVAMDERSRRKLKLGLTGLQLCLTYGDDQQKSRHFKFVDVGQPSSVVRFEYQKRDRDGNVGDTCEMTVEQYFYEIKHIPLKYPNLPVIQVGPKQRKIFIPMELLVLSEKPQKIKRNLTEFQKSALLRWCAYDPGDRMDRIQYLMDAQRVQECEFVNNYGVEIEPRFIRVPGRVIPPPKIATQCDEMNKYKPVEVREGQWKLLQYQFTKCHDNMVLCVVDVGECIDNSNTAKQALDCFMRACELFGMKWATYESLRERWNPDAVTQLGPMMKYFKDEAQQHFPGSEIVVLFVMREKNPKVYGIIKKVCDLESGVACQCILKKTFENMAKNRPESSATAHNVCLKVNVKMGGINNRVYPSSSVWIKFTNRESPTLHVGVDVTHPGVGRRGNSIASVVANVDPEASRYEASIKVQLPSEERVVYMVESLKERLLAYYVANNRRPEHIIIYRDGISESEFLTTLREELGSAQAACMKLDETYKPTISYVIVQKRHHTRFFVTRPTDGVGRNKNVPPGTVVEECVSSQTYSDFFLASQTGAIGTTRPCHYYVLYDSWECTADEWQELVFGLCHLYCRCNKSVSLPAPVYYAHLACARASVHSSIISSVGSSYDERSAQYERDRGGARSELETTRTLQADLAIAATTPRMYFV